MNISVLGKEEVERIKDLVFSYEFNDYRAYRMLNKEKLKGYLFNQISTSLQNKSNWALIAEDKKRVIGLAALNFLPWDTRHFGIKMAKIDYLMAVGDYGKAFAIKNRLLTCLLQLCKKDKINHLSCRIDTSDTSGIHALETNNFRLMDTLVTYVFNRHRHKILQIKELYRVRKFKGKDLDKLVALAKASFTKNRFHEDSHILNTRANNLYAEWVKNYCQGKIDGKVLVVENKETDGVGFLLYKVNKELAKFTGYRIIGQGLAAVSPKAKGAYLSLIKATIKDTVSFYDYAEFDALIHNYEVIRILQKFNFEITKVTHTFHNWLEISNFHRS